MFCISRQVPSAMESVKIVKRGSRPTERPCFGRARRGGGAGALLGSIPARQFGPRPRRSARVRPAPRPPPHSTPYCSAHATLANPSPHWTVASRRLTPNVNTRQSTKKGQQSCLKPPRDRLLREWRTVFALFPRCHRPGGEKLD